MQFFKILFTVDIQLVNLRIVAKTWNVRIMFWLTSSPGFEPCPVWCSLVHAMLCWVCFFPYLHIPSSRWQWRSLRVCERNEWDKLGLLGKVQCLKGMKINEGVTKIRSAESRWEAAWVFSLKRCQILPAIIPISDATSANQQQCWYHLWQHQNS